MVQGWLGGLATGVVALWLATLPAAAQNPQDFDVWLERVKAEALDRGIRKEIVDSALSDLHPLDRVLELDRKQPEFTLTFEDYVARAVSPQRVDQGHKLLKENRPLLRTVAKKYGVPSNVLVAMWGIESDYGRLTGGFSVIPALATLAYDGRRSQYFRGELFNALTILGDGKATLAQMRGSWAGAMGQCQFMPSTYLKFAQDWQGGNRPDIWSSNADVFASSANYLSHLGWNPGQNWGRAVQLPKRGMASVLFGLDVKRSVKDWNRLGVRLPNGKPLPRSNVEASLIRAETGKGEDSGVGAPYLVYDNFRVFMKWNRSTFFALAAGTLADRLANK